MKKISFFILALIMLSLACSKSAINRGGGPVTTLTNPAEVVHADDEPYAGAVFDPETWARSTCARVISSGALHVRLDADLLGDVVGYLHPDDLVIVDDQSDSMWWRVRGRGLSGYARSIYLEEVSCKEWR